jgi:Ca2+/H+ antiporter
MAIVGALTLVTLLAVFLVEEIDDVVEAGIPDQFLGLIMLPLAEKAAEHLTAIDEAWDGQMVGSSSLVIVGETNVLVELRLVPLSWTIDSNCAI